MRSIIITKSGHHSRHAAGCEFHPTLKFERPHKPHEMTNFDGNLQNGSEEFLAEERLIKEKNVKEDSVQKKND